MWNFIVYVNVCDINEILIFCILVIFVIIYSRLGLVLIEFVKYVVGKNIKWWCSIRVKWFFFIVWDLYCYFLIIWFFREFFLYVEVLFLIIFRNVCWYFWYLFYFEMFFFWYLYRNFFSLVFGKVFDEIFMVMVFCF